MPTVRRPLAALVPDTALLVPGVSGRADVLVAERAAALGALRRLVAAGPARVVLVTASGRGPEAPGRPDLSAAGVLLPAVPTVPAMPGVPGSPPADVATSVGLLLLAAAGWTGPTLRLGADDDADRTREHARVLADTHPDTDTPTDAHDGGTAFVLVGSLSARHGPDAPLAEDPRAPAFDDAVLADLALLDEAAAARLAAVARDLARELAVSAWGPWQALLGAVPAWRARGPLVGEVVASGAPLGAAVATVLWGRP